MDGIGMCPDCLYRRKRVSRCDFRLAVQSYNILRGKSIAWIYAVLGLS